MARNPKDDKKQTVAKKNAAKARQLHQEILERSDALSGAKKRVTGASEKVVSNLAKIVAREEKKIFDLQKALSRLDKKSSEYKEEKARLTSELDETDKRAKAFSQLSDTLEASEATTKLLLSSVIKGDKGIDSLTSQIASFLSQITLAQEATKDSLGFDRRKLLEELEQALDKAEIEKIQKRLESLDKWIKKPLEKTGIYGALAGTLGATFFGPIGKQLADTVSLSERIQGTVDSGLDKLIGKSKEIEEEQSEFVRKLAKDQARQHKQDQLDKQEKTKEKRLNEKQTLHDKLFRKRLLDNQKDLKDTQNKTDSKFSKFFNFGAGSLVGALAATVPKMWSFVARAPGALLRVGAGAMAFIGPVLKRFLGPVAWLLTAFEGGQFIGKWINDKFGDQIGDFVWNTMEKIKGAGEWVKDTYHAALEKGGELLDWGKQKIDEVKEAFDTLMKLKELALNWAKDKVTGLFQSGKERLASGWNTAKSTAASQFTRAKDTSVSLAGSFIQHHVSGAQAIASGAQNLFSGQALLNTFRQSQGSVIDAIRQASSMVGVPFNFMLAMAKQESGLDPKAKAPTSSATGLYQFISSTWQAMVGKYGSKYGIGIGDIEDPLANAIMGAHYVKDNEKILSSAGIPVDFTTLYGAHFLGAGGAKKLFGADRMQNASTLLPQAAQANSWVFKNSDGSDRTVGEVIDFLYKKVGSAGQSTSVSFASTGTAFSGGSPQGSSPVSSPMQSQTQTPLIMSDAGSTPTTAIERPTKGKTSMDEIPMYVDDTSLMALSLGAL